MQVFAVIMVFRGLIEVAVANNALPRHTRLPDKMAYEITRLYLPEFAILLIFGSCLFDLLDGRLARLGGQDSPFGREFDSLADIISFGMAPAMLLAKAVLLPLREMGWVIGFVYLLCGAMRLARFNSLAALPKKAANPGDFRGIPIPMAAGFIAPLTFLIMQIYENDRELGPWRFVLAGAMLGLSWLMISDVRYPSFRRTRLAHPRNLRRAGHRCPDPRRRGEILLHRAGGGLQRLSGLRDDPPVALPTLAPRHRSGTRPRGRSDPDQAGMIPWTSHEAPGRFRYRTHLPLPRPRLLAGRGHRATGTTPAGNSATAWIPSPDWRNASLYPTSSAPGCC